MPPTVKAKWDDNDVLGQAMLIAYNQIRDLEDAEHEIALLKAQGGVK